MQTPDFYAELARISTTHAANLAADHGWQITPEHIAGIWQALLDHPGAVERFLREIRSAAKLSHANVVGAYHALQQGELLAFAMGYVEGQD